jgi:hypothetical protein
MSDGVQYTEIAGRHVPVQPGPLTRLYFSHDCEERDPAGYYHFWTMKNEEKKLRPGRCFHDKDPGWRFRETEYRPNEQEVWAEAQTAIFVRPSSLQEVEDWLNGHPGDAPCAQYGEQNGQPIKIGRHPVDAHYIVQVQAAPPPTEPSSPS